MYIGGIALEPSMMKVIADFLAASGMYGIVSILGIAYWKMATKKDDELRMIYNRLIELTQAQTAALVDVKGVLVSLKEAIERMGK
jgi:hypothetical protein